MQQPQVSSECLDILKRILVADPNQRISMEEVKQHVWFSTGLPPGALEMNKFLLQGLTTMDDVRSITPITDKLPFINILPPQEVTQGCVPWECHMIWKFHAVLVVGCFAPEFSSDCLACDVASGMVKITRRFRGVCCAELGTVSGQDWRYCRPSNACGSSRRDSLGMPALNWQALMNIVPCQKSDHYLFISIFQVHSCRDLYPASRFFWRLIVKSGK